MFRRISASAILLFGLVVGFQNCTNSTDFNGQDQRIQNNGNGWPYEGKLYVSTDTCPADTSPVAKLKMLASQDALLVKENCQILKNPVTIPNAELQLNADQPQTIYYQGREFVLEPVPANKVAYGQQTQYWSTVAGTSINSAPFPNPTIAGDLIICTVLYNSPNGVAQVSSLTDNLGNLYQRAVNPINSARALGQGNGNGYTSEAWYAENVNAGVGHQATATFSETMPSNQHIACYEYSGIAAQNSLDQVVGDYSIPGTKPNITLGPVSPNWSNELVFVLYYGNVDPLPSAFTARSTPQDGASDQFITQPDSVQLSIPTSSGSAAAILTFKASD
ncbi:MAG: hypothetical protein AB7F86_01715 [Bdellovibrionales bacterium]